MIHAAENANPRAQGTLGSMYARGELTGKKDNVNAYMWMSVSERLMHSQPDAVNAKLAARNKAIISKRMTPVQIAKAKILADECVRKKYKGC